jgi:hypothetical protein
MYYDALTEYFYNCPDCFTFPAICDASGWYSLNLTVIALRIS